MHIGLSQQAIKLVFVEYLLSLRAGARTGLAMTGNLEAERQTPIQVIGLKQQTIQQSLAGMPP